MMNNFCGQKILVAGGTSGIGLVTAKLLSELGAKVTVFGRNAEKFSAVIQDHSFSRTSRAVDACKRTDLDNFFLELGTFDHLVITLSGGKGAGRFADLELDALKAGFEGKFWAQVNCLQAALPYLSAGGSVTLLTAISATSRQRGYSGLAAINGAIEAMIPILAKELSPIRINAVSPGVINTTWWDQFDPAKKKGAFDSLLEDIILKRIGEAKEVANAICNVIGMGYYTGRVLPIDGGLGL
jgi:NAD(P)-dependent dehydrogenase (short-subunit alcohol dehydrogenase family)